MSFKYTAPKRTEKNKDEIRSLWSESQVVDNIVNEEDISLLNSMLKYGDYEMVPGQGDFKLEMVYLTGIEEVESLLRKKLSQFELEPYYFREILQFKIEKPFNLHSDGGKDPQEIPYKNFVIWLDASDEDVGGIVLFKQHTYFSWSLTNTYTDNSNFIMEGSHSDHIENYNENSQIDPQLREQFLYHVPDRDLKGLEIEQCVPYAKNRAVLFDSCQLHTTASTPKKSGWKKGIMISLSRDLC